MKNQDKNSEEITRKEAIKKIGTYGKYAALTAIGTYLILSPKKAQAQSPAEPGTGF
ncbi:hypothetical protein [Polaribacter gangjinensis]|uniref:hypothetical protein n=1 Tax=Polaribacter gangjinensis TaxID=574710 RepID=UPI0014742D0C|nr:hypothetical protein [Polaribacter gangjinensis]